MFTGIIHKVSKVRQIIFTGIYCKLTVESPFLPSEVTPGDSICVNGVCLTATAIENNTISFDVQSETLNRTYFSELKPGDALNLELAIPLNGRLGGHIVQGHVDEIGIVEKNEKSGDDWILQIKAGKNFISRLIQKCSVAIDGISLTVVNVGESFFTAHIVPHTIENTNLKFKKKNDKVNLESDIIGKYIYNYLSNLDFDKNQSLLNKLKEGGFI